MEKAFFTDYAPPPELPDTAIYTEAPPGRDYGMDLGDLNNLDVTIPPEFLQREPDYHEPRDPIQDAQEAENLNSAELAERDVPDQYPPEEVMDLNAFEPQETFDIPDIADAPNFDAVPADVGFAPDFDMPMDF